LPSKIDTTLQVHLDESVSPVSSALQNKPLLAIARVVSDVSAWLQASPETLLRERWTVNVPGSKRSAYDPALFGSCTFYHYVRPLTYFL
jgi:hypothetical protein